MRRLAIPVALLAAILVAAPAAAASTTRVSVKSDGKQANGSSSDSSISANGRYVAFDSVASNLVAKDTNGTVDVFVRDRSTGKTKRVSVRSDGKQGKGYSYSPSISANGRYVAFVSGAKNLVARDTNGTEDIFVHDRVTKKTTRVSVKSNGKEANGGNSFDPSISADGRVVAFESDASNLVARDTNGRDDVFVHDRVTKKTTRVSVKSNGKQGTGGNSFSPSISADGRYVAFTSFAPNLVAKDTNGRLDVFVHDRVTKKTTRVSVTSDGAEGTGESLRPSISANGRYVAFPSYASDLVAGDEKGFVDVFVRDRVAKKTTRVSVRSDGAEGTGESYEPSISADGRHVAFMSYATNLVAGDTNEAGDVFVHDRVTGKTSRVSVTSDGTEGNGGNSSFASISANGRFVAFMSQADLVAEDTNEVGDIFVRAR
jgi:Tol biopolymer transport system component